MAEESLIQQTSLAPMVIKIKGEIYARAWGVNYVYLLWALIYETAFVVFLPVYLTEMVFNEGKQKLWLSNVGMVFIGFLFLLGSVMAWFTWTHIARTNVFHVPVYTPPLIRVMPAIVLIGTLLFLAIGPYREKITFATGSLNPPKPLLLMLAGCCWAILLYGIVLLGFGIAPGFPPLIAVFSGLTLAGCAIYFIPHWTSSRLWQSKHTFFVISGTLLGSMLAGFIGFIGATPPDLYFKIAANALAVIFLVRLGYSILKFQHE
jgi:hypothetical protein